MKDPHAVRILRALAAQLEDQGIPEQPFIVETDSREEVRLFIAVWRNSGDRRMMAVPIGEKAIEG